MVTRDSLDLGMKTRARSVVTGGGGGCVTPDLIYDYYYITGDHSR